jgi:bacterial/archaeal transporter family-2 protein
MNGPLRSTLTNPWLTSLISFLPVIAFLACQVLCVPRPLPTLHWWALGGLVGAFAIIAGLLFVTQGWGRRVCGVTITANILMSLPIDKFGWFGMEVHPLNGWRMLGVAFGEWDYPDREVLTKAPDVG